MIRALYKRFTFILSVSVVSSLIVYIFSECIGFLNTFGRLFSSFAIFITVLTVDSYRFSYSFWKIKDYFIGQFFPYLLFSGLGYYLFYNLPAKLCNYIVIPLRFMEAFDINSFQSITCVNVIAIVLITLSRIIGAYQGKKMFDFVIEDNTEID